MSTTIQQSNPSSKFQKTMGGSIKSLFSPGTRTYFVLEHKSNTEKHNIGESANFMTDYVEIGRGNNYAVNFGDDCKSVSRPHAAIARNYGNWMLTPLSKTNKTLVNGQIINSETILKNGDEIQLSSAGPKLSFLIPANPKVSGLNFTIRMRAAMNEAIRPYKKTISIISLIFVLAISGLLYFTLIAKKENEKFVDNLKYRTDSLKHDADSLKKNFLSLSNKLNDIKKLPAKIRIKYVKDTSTIHLQPARPDFNKLLPFIYYLEMEKIIIKSKINGAVKEIEFGASGTGFLLTDGTFVTARHCVEPWLFDNDLIEESYYATNKDYAVTLKLTAYSPDGSKLTFTSDQFTVNRNSDVIETATDSTTGKKYDYTVAELNGSDWAVCHTNNSNKNDGLVFDKELSGSLQPPDRLTVFGYSFRIGAHENARYSECDVSGIGLNNGDITISGRGFDQGNSGGPAFFTNNKGELVVVGIVSAERGNQGYVVPISAIK